MVEQYVWRDADLYHLCGGGTYQLSGIYTGVPADCGEAGLFLFHSDALLLHTDAGDRREQMAGDSGGICICVLCAEAVADLARRLKVEMPITVMMGDVLSSKLTAHDAIKKLMGRDPKIEA